MSIVYVGADVHQASTTMVMLDDQGKKMQETVIRTTPENLLSAMRALDGRVRIAVEESNHSVWIYELLESVVDEVIVCDPKRNNFADVLDKSDRKDAYGLAWLNYAGLLKPIYHGDAVHSALKQLVKSHGHCDTRRTNAMNAIRGVFANCGRWSRSSNLFTVDGREAWLAELDNVGARMRLRNLYAEFDLLSKLKADTHKEMVRVARQQSGWRWVQSIPGIGDVRAAQILGVIGTPWRFRTRRQLWRYSGLAVVDRTTDDYDENLQRRRRHKVRGLNPDRNAMMKSAFKGAATSALQFPDTYPEIAAYYERQLANHQSEENVRVNVARKLAACTLTIWKRQEVYNPTKARW